MKKDRNTSANATELRRQAEARLRAAATQGALARTEADTQRLVHELQVHQIELEMQNEELRRSRAEVETGLVRYTELYDFAPVGYLTLDRDGTILKVNLTGTRLLGVERSRLVGRRFGILVAEADRPVFNIFLKKVFTSQAEELCEVALLKEGKGPLTVHITAMLTQDGQECRATMADITERKQAEEALRQLNENLERRVAERTELAAKRAMQLQALAMELTEAEERERQRLSQLLHDDLQQSLAAARMQLQAACECPPADTNMLVNIEKILSESLNRARSLSHELSPPVLHHSGLVASLEWLTQQMKAQFGLQVQLESDGAQQFESPLLKVFLFRAVQELLFNVVKHARVKTAQVALSSSDGCLAVSVTDQGQGFDLGILDYITTLGGIGLLSLKERANYIGGSLSMESAAGKGSSFTLKVPINLDKAEKIDHPTTDLQDCTPAKSTLPADRGGIRLLFIDDHQVMRQGLIRLVNGQPLIQVVGEAANGREAIERVRQLRPDVVLMDVSMPEMDGIEATRRIKVEWPEVRVIGLSMFDDENTSQRMRDAGAEIFMSKTTSPAEMLKAIYGTAPIRTSLPALKSAD